MWPQIAEQNSLSLGKKIVVDPEKFIAKLSWIDLLCIWNQTYSLVQSDT